MLKFNICNLIFACVIFLCVMFVDLYTKDNHQYYSIKLSRYLEDQFLILRYYFWLFSYPLYYCIPFFVMGALFYRRDKREALMGVFVLMLDSFTANTLKIILHDGRPCFYSYKISQNFGCSCAFGDPSGHSSSTLLFYFYIYNSYFKKQSDYSDALKKFILVLWILIFVNVGCSRVFYGKHFFMQVLSGWSLGYINICIYYMIDRNKIFDVIFNLPIQQNQNKIQQGKPNKKIRQNKEKKRSLYIYVIFFVFEMIAFAATLISVTVALQFEDNPYHPYSQPVCDEKCFQGERYLSYNSLRSTMMYQFFLFTLLIVGNRKTRIFFNNQNYYRESCPSNKLFFIPLRLMIFLVTMLPLGLAFALSSFMISIWVIVAVMLIVGVVQALFLTQLFPYMLKKTNAHIKGDLFIGFEN